MSLFDEGRVQDLCARLLDKQNERGCSFDSKHGRELLALLQAVGGVKPLGRSARYILTDPGIDYLTRQLAQVAPQQPDKRDSVRALGLTLPSPLNQASFHALWHGDSKHPRSDTVPDQVSIEITLTQDEVIRMRTLTPLSLIDLHGQPQDMTPLMTLLGELALPERCLSRLQGIAWQGRQIVTVENKGAFVDYPLQAGELLIYVPGRNTSLARQLLPLLPSTIPWAHFGDLDQRGLDIAAELANAVNRPLALWLPCNLMEYVHHYARPLTRRLEGQKGSRGKTPWRGSLAIAQPDQVLAAVFMHLIESRLWLEQEVLVTSPCWQAWPAGAAQQ